MYSVIAKSQVLFSKRFYLYASYNKKIESTHCAKNKAGRAGTASIIIITINCEPYSLVFRSKLCTQCVEFQSIELKS